MGMNAQADAREREYRGDGAVPMDLLNPPIANMTHE